MTQLDPRAALILSDDELAFFYYACELFPSNESPLHFLEDEQREPADLAQTHAALKERHLVIGDTTQPASELARRLCVVAECGARVSFKVKHGDARARRDFYLNDGHAVEYRGGDGEHTFGPVQSERELASSLARALPAKTRVESQPLRLSASDYLVFAVFARDVRENPQPARSESAMTVDEVLAYFDEPESKFVRTPNDDNWQGSVRALSHQGVLVDRGGGFELHPAFHPLARELAAERQHTIVRFDFLEEHWLARELHLYPTSESVFRIGTQADGAVAIEELSLARLDERMLRVVTTLPNLLVPQAV